MHNSNAVSNMGYFGEDATRQEDSDAALSSQASQKITDLDNARRI